MGPSQGSSGPWGGGGGRGEGEGLGWTEERLAGTATQDNKAIVHSIIPLNKSSYVLILVCTLQCTYAALRLLDVHVPLPTRDVQLYRYLCGPTAPSACARTIS